MTTNEANPSAGPQTAPSTLAEGQKLAGCYLLKTRLSTGAEGDLWLAHDEVIGKDISLEFLPSAVRSDGLALTDIRQAIKRDRQLIHPNILRVYDFIEEPEWAAISMDAFDGESLAAMIRKKDSSAFNTGEIEPWFSELCQTLEEAHKIGLIHRNVSPGNIHFRTDGKLSLMGFGYSRCIEDALRRAQGAQGVGSPYLSPQMLDGEAAAKTDDVYQCGVLLFQLLTGAPPFSGDGMAENIRRTPPKLVNETRPGNLERVPEHWQQAIAACLAKSPAQRPHGAADLAQRLRTARADVPTPAATAGAAMPVTIDTAGDKTDSHGGTDLLATQENAPEKSAPVKRTVSTTAETVAPAGDTASRERPEKSLPVDSGSLVKTGKPKSEAFKPEPYGSVYGNRPRFPTAGVAIAVGLLAIAAIGYHFIGSRKPALPPDYLANEPVNAATPRGEDAPGTREGSGGVGKAPSSAASDHGKPGGAENEKPDLSETGKPPVVVVRAPLPTSKPDGAATASAAGNPIEKNLLEKQAALEKAKQAAQSAEKSRAELARQQQQAETDAAAAQKVLDDKAKALAPAKKAADEILARKKKLEDDQKAAETASQEAQQMAAEKQRIATAAKQAVEDLTAKNQDKLAALEKANTELASLEKAVGEKQRVASLAAKAVADAEVTRQQQLDAVKTTEQDVAQAQAAVAEAQRNREAKEAERKKLEQELKDLQVLMNAKLQEIKDRQRALEGGTASPLEATPAPAATPAPKATEKPAPTPIRINPATPAPQATPPPSAMLFITPPPASLLAKPATPEPAKNPPQPGPEVNLQVPPSDAAPAPAAGNVNSLGQSFVSVGDVDFCIWQTRVKDFEVFAKAVNLKSTAWRSPGFKQAPDHPVVNVTWQEAIAFCKWLTDKEHKEGTLPPNQYYRLPTDVEWSKAVGLPEEPGKTPAERDMVVPDVYPWGKEWPPPAGAGNYTGEETGSDVAIKGYNDGFAWTSPVGSFKPNKYGLYDMGGNVWQWCMDAWSPDSKGKVLRGASWYNGALKLSLLSSCRVHAAADSSTDNYGFRIVRASEALRATKK